MLEVVASHEGERRYFTLPEVGAEVSIGSAPDNDWVLPYPGVSRRHAWARRDEAGIVLRDAHSKNGVRVGGRKCGEVVLRVGMEVEIGLARLWLKDLHASDPIVPLAKLLPERPAVQGSLSSTPELDSGNGRGRSAALELARSLASLAALSVVEREHHLERLRELLGASAVVVAAESRRADLPLSAMVGDLPASDALQALASAISSNAVRAEVGPETWILASIGDRSALRIAALVPAPAAAEEWRELILLVCGQALFARSRSAGDHPGELVHPGDPLRYPPELVLGPSPAFQQLLADLRATVGAGRNFLLLGETGTGKELFARLIHASGPVAAGPFVPCNVAEIPSELIESELFGIGERAATGVDARAGLFREADGGTLFLDEIGELPLPLQSKLLRVLQEREVRAVGTRAATRKPLDVRIVAATNRDLLGSAREGKFREDLYYRLAVIVHRIPPLRERPQDVPTLALALTERLATAHGKRLRGVRAQALKFLAELPWPGNVRQLENELTRALLVCPQGEALGLEHFAADLRERTAVAMSSGASSPAVEASARFMDRRAELERKEIREALERAHGSFTGAARLLGITRQGLFKRRRRLGMA